MEIDYTSESIRILKEELDKFINDLFNEEYNIKINLIKERVELIEEDCVFLKNIYSTYLSYNMFYIYCCAYDLIYTDPTLFNNMEKIQKLIENMEFKFGYESEKYKLTDIVNHIKSVYTVCGENEKDLKLILRAKYPFYETNIDIESFFESYVIIIEFAILYKKIHSYDRIKSRLFLKKILDINVYNHVKNLFYDIAIIKSINKFIDDTFKDDFNKLLLNFDFIIDNFDFIQEYAKYNKNLVDYFKHEVIPNEKLRTKLKSIYLSFSVIPVIFFIYEILKYDDEEMIFQIFEILEFKGKILIYDIQFIINIFSILTPPKYSHLHDKLIESYKKYYYHKIYENYNYQNKYLKYKLKFLKLKKSNEKKLTNKS